MGRLSHTQPKSCCIHNLLFLVLNSDTTNPPGTGGRLLDPKLRDKLRSEAKRLVESMPTKDHKRKGIEDTLLRVLFRVFLRMMRYTGYSAF